MTRVWIFSLCLVLLFACSSSDEDSPASADAQLRSVSDSESGSDVAVSADSQAQPDAAQAQPAVPSSRLVVIQTLGFAKEDKPGSGVAPGFNLDDKVSEDGDESTCGHGDFTSPEGIPGIDNKLATLVPLFDIVGIGAAESLLQSVIEEGGILLMLQVDGIDDPVNDDEVSLRIRAGSGVPLLGTDGLLLAGQTFSLHEESPETEATGSIKDGVLTAGPFKARLPILVFGVHYELTFHSSRVRAEWTEGGGLTNGIMGGSSEISELYTIGEKAAADDPSVLEALKVVLKGSGDMAKGDDGACSQISATLAFNAVSAFLFSEDK